MSSKLLEYQELDKKLKNIRKETGTLDDQKVLQTLNNTIKDAQGKIKELEEASKQLVVALNKLMGVQKKGIAYVQKCKDTDIEKMSGEELADFDAKTTQTAKQLAELDARILAHNNEVKKIVMDYRAYRKIILDAKDKKEVIKNASADKLAKAQPQIDAIKKDMLALEKDIDASKLTRYKALKADGIFPVIVPLTEKKCGYCRVELSKSALDTLKTNGVYECENCRRLIYVDKD